MPFEQKYSAETREAATAKALELRNADPKDRTVIRVVSEEFGVGAQSLRSWVAIASPAEAKPTKRGRRPKSSAVITTQAAPSEAAQQQPGPFRLPEPMSYADALRRPIVASELEALESEASELRRGNEALKAAMRVLLAT